MPEIYCSTLLRRELHPMAELGFGVKNTADFVIAKLRAIGIEANRVGGTNGVLGIIRGAEPGPVLMLRSDMDALPFIEDGKTVAVHACGHDAHMAMLLEAASRLKGKVRRGTLKLLFQPAEELLTGALRMIEEGAADDVDIAVGAHVRPVQDLKPGTLCAGVSYNGFAFPKVTVRGRLAHGARPHLGVNAIEAAAAVVFAIRSIHMSPDTHWTVVPSRIRAEGPMNVVPPLCEMQFDVRAKENRVMAELLEKFVAAAKAGAASVGAEAEVEVGRIGPAPEYDPEIHEELASCIRELGEGVLAPDCGGGSEDFNYFKSYRPSIRTGYIGVGVGAAPGLHDRHMDFDDSLLPMGAKVLAAFALRHLG